MINSLPTLYKRDTTGKVREWTIQYKDAATRTIAGIHEGNLVKSGWKEATPKNEGKANATTAFEQAVKEANADWDKKVERLIPTISLNHNLHMTTQKDHNQVVLVNLS